VTVRTFAVGLWKEWRDHRLVSVALLLALPVMVLAGAWAFGDRIPSPQFGGFAVFVLNVAQALYVLAVASESFSGERRRGTQDFLRRLPRGLARSFAAKLGAYVLGTLLALVWGFVVAWAACRLFGPDAAARDLTSAMRQPQPLAALIALLLVVLGLWTLLLSTFVPQGGAATVGAALLLGLLGLPAYFAFRDWPWLLPLADLGTIRIGIAFFAALAVVALAFAYLRGNRLVASAWSPAWRCLVFVGVATAGGFAWGAVALNRALRIEPHDPEFRIQEAYVGTGGRFLYLTVFRGKYPYRQPSDRTGGGTPTQPWIVDLDDGTWRVAGTHFQGWAVPLCSFQGGRQPILKRYTQDSRDVAWFDAGAAELRKILPDDVRTPDVLAWQRSVMPALAWHRDAQGRALWLENGRLVREGEKVPVTMAPPGLGDPWYAAIPGGWRGTAYALTGEGRLTGSSQFLMDAATGTPRPFPHSADTVYGDLVLSPDTLLRRMQSRTPAGAPRPGPWMVVDVRTGTAIPAVNAPWVAPIQPLPDDRALALLGADREQPVLCSWDPRTGATTPILDEKDQPIPAQGAVRVASAPGGLSVLQVFGPRTEAGSGTVLLALLDERSGRAPSVIVPCTDVQVICVESDASLVLLLDSQRVVRVAIPKDGAPGRPGVALETLFPR
jgi:hypothetical protein